MTTTGLRNAYRLLGNVAVVWGLALVLLLPTARLGWFGRVHGLVESIVKYVSGDTSPEVGLLIVRLYQIAVPLGIVCLSIGFWILWRAVTVRRAGRCVKCDYDLRGVTTPECPECGTLFEMHSADRPR